MSLFERIQKKIIIESSSDTTGQNKGNRNRKKKFSSNISKTVDPNQQQELPFDYSKTGKENPVKGVKSPRDIIGNKRKQGRPFGSKNRPKETSPYQQQELPFDDGKKKRAPRKGVDYFFDPDKAKADREKLISKRKEYGIDRKGNISDAGVERYARKTKQLSSGSNLPVNITQADKDLAKKRLTDKYGRNLPRKRPSNAKSLEQIKKEIDSRPPDARTKPKLIKTKVSDKEIRDLIKQGKQAIPKKSTKVTPTNIEKIGRAKQGLDDLIIGARPGEAEKTKKLLRKQQRIITKRITTPSAKEIEQSQKILDKTQTKPVKQFDGKSFDDFLRDAKKKSKKALQDVKNIKVEPVTKIGSKVSVGNQIPYVSPPPIKDPTKGLKFQKARSIVPKNKTLRAIQRAARKNPRLALAATVLGTIGTVAVGNRLLNRKSGIGAGGAGKKDPLVANVKATYFLDPKKTQFSMNTSKDPNKPNYQIIKNPKLAK